MKVLFGHFGYTSLILGVLVVATFFGVASKISGAGLPIVTQVSQKPGTAGEGDKPVYAPGKPLSCESFASLFDTLVINAHDVKGSYLIIIVHLGKNERVDQPGKIRLRKIEAYLERHNVNHVTAEGSRDVGSGRIEIFVGGKLVAAIPTETNVAAVCSGKVNPFL